MKVQKEKIR